MSPLISIFPSNSLMWLPTKGPGVSLLISLRLCWCWQTNTLSFNLLTFACPVQGCCPAQDVAVTTGHSVSTSPFGCEDPHCAWVGAVAFFGQAFLQSPKYFLQVVEGLPRPASPSSIFEQKEVKFNPLSSGEESQRGLELLEASSVEGCYT